MSRPHRFTSEAGPQDAHLRLLAMSDLHMRLMPYDYIADRPVAGQGLALLGTEVEIARSEAANTLTFDIGDALEGSPVDQILAAALPPEGHPMLQAFAALGVDAATLGNHDFNHGLEALERGLAASPIPMTLANIVRSRGDTPLSDTAFLPPTLLLERQIICGDGVARPLTIGVLGVAPPQTLEWDSDKIGSALVARDIVDAVAAWAPDLRRQGADIVVVLCHSGIAGHVAVPFMEHAAVPVAAIPEVDVVLAGHAHGLFPDAGFEVAEGAQGVVDAEAGALHGTPTVMPGFWGNRLGVVDLKLAHGPHGWRIVESAAALRAVRSDAPHTGVLQAVAAHHAATLRDVQRPVARSSRRFDTYFAQIADVPSTQIVNAAAVAAVRRGLAGQTEANLPILSATSPLKAGGLQGPDNYTDVPAGVITARHIVDLYAYQNTLVALLATGAEVRDWLERSASVFHSVKTGDRRAPLLDPAHPSYAFDVLSGVTYRIDLSALPLFDAAGQRLAGGGRIRDLSFQGRPVADADRFVLATNTYRTGHGGNFPLPAATPLRLTQPASVRDHLTRYLADGGSDHPLPPPSWGFVSQPGTTALFRTGRGAAEADIPGADAPSGPVLTPLEPDAEGYCLFELDLSRAHLLGPG